ncbi:GAF domain-containing sensor histidine kinase [Pedobacter sp. KBS0701]|uniref:GAF domain-containing sensor histidine kinase n=1 Tax=Pedobacter sp. KBS0701 TaxID=2578106 RepID=UPI00110F2C34|nr:GAF domain-containing sensor histidine kinase [Pedobacter sp. KBS0701]QDW23624.1 GAF domain-containing sensor histidine kinase [Pedobacter sp. KBS0701]
MSKFSKPSNTTSEYESQRLNKLKRYDIIDTPPELLFDLIAEIAKITFKAAGSFVSFIDKTQVYLKANTSPIQVSIINKEDSLCTIASKSADITLIENTETCIEVKDNAYVKINNGIRFYAAAPITTMEGFVIGTVSVMDDKPRYDIKQDQLSVLKWLARITLEKLESRLINRISVRAYDDRLHRLAHDMKNPATSLIAYGQLLDKNLLSQEKLASLGNKIEHTGRKIELTMNNLLNEAKNENAAIDLEFKTVKVMDLLQAVVTTFDFTLKQKQQTLKINCQTDGYIQVDQERINDVFNNLLSNAIKYSHMCATIEIICTAEDSNIVFEFKDYGLGMTTDDIAKLFTKFAKLSSVPTAKERSNGIGLYIVKTLVQLHGGKVWANSAGKDLGSSFFISLPKLESMPITD